MTAAPVATAAEAAAAAAAAEEEEFIIFHKLQLLGLRTGLLGDGYCTA